MIRSAFGVEDDRISKAKGDKRATATAATLGAGIGGGVGASRLKDVKVQYAQEKGQMKEWGEERADQTRRAEEAEARAKTRPGYTRMAQVHRQLADEAGAFSQEAAHNVKRAVRVGVRRVGRGALVGGTLLGAGMYGHRQNKKQQ